MKIAAFYENIKEGVPHQNRNMRDTLAFLKDQGLDNLYMSDHSLQEDRDILLPIMKELSLGLEGLFHFCDFSRNPEEKDYVATINLAKEFGAGHVLLLPGMYFDDLDKEMQKQNMIRGLKEAVSYGKQRGVRVSLEDFDGLIAPYCDIEGVKFFLDAIPDLACSFDTGNFIMYHEDEMEALTLFENRLCTIHLKDRSDIPLHPGNKGKVCADGVRKYPAPVGYGNIRMEEIMQRLSDIGYSGSVIAELFDCDPKYMIEDIAKSIRWIKESRKENE